MPRNARRYDLFLPLTYNDGRPIARKLFDVVERRLLERFRGLTSQRHEFSLRGMWQTRRRRYDDEVIVMTALDLRRQGSTRFISSLKAKLLEEFEQMEILITETRLRVH